MTANCADFLPKASVLSLSKDAVLAQKGVFRDPSRFDRLSVTMFAPKLRYAQALCEVDSSGELYYTVYQDITT